MESTSYIREITLLTGPIGVAILTRLFALQDKVKSLSSTDALDSTQLAKVFDNDENYLFLLREKQKRDTFKKYYKYYPSHDKAIAVTALYNKCNGEYSIDEILDVVTGLGNLETWRKDKTKDVFRKTIRFFLWAMILALSIALLYMAIYTFQILAFQISKISSNAIIPILQFLIMSLVAAFEIVFMLKEQRKLAIAIDMYQNLAINDLS